MRHQERGRYPIWWSVFVEAQKGARATVQEVRVAGHNMLSRQFGICLTGFKRSLSVVAPGDTPRVHNLCRGLASFLNRPPREPLQKPAPG